MITAYPHASGAGLLGQVLGALGATPAVTSLQNAVNRFYNVAKFAPLSVDGNMGPFTHGATVKAVQFAIGIVGGPVTEIDKLALKALLPGLTSATGPQAFAVHNAPGITSALTNVADKLQLPTKPPSSGGGGGGGGGSALPPLVKSPALWVRFQALPMWQQAAIGIAIVGGGIFLYNRFAKPAGALSGATSFRRIGADAYRDGLTAAEAIAQARRSRTVDADAADQIRRGYNVARGVPT